MTDRSDTEQPPDNDDPYGLPRFPLEDTLDAWDDQSDIAMRDVRIFTRGTTTAFLISHPGVWDVVLSDGRGTITTDAVPPVEIAGILQRAIEDS